MKYKEDFIGSLSQFYKNILAELREFKLSKNIEGISHQNIVPFSTYSPWLDDPFFLELFNKIKYYTLVDIYRCYELYSFLTRNIHLNGNVLEVGVWRGGTGCLLGSTLNRVDPNSVIYLVDTFEGVVKVSDKDTFYKGREHSDTKISIVQNLIKELDLKNVHILKGVFPDEFSDYSFDFSFRLCHIDVDTYQSAKDVFNFIWPYIEIGGCVIFDDFGFWGCEGVTQFCNEISLNDSIFLHNLNGHAIFVKKGYAIE